MKHSTRLIEGIGVAVVVLVMGLAVDAIAGALGAPAWVFMAVLVCGIALAAKVLR